MVCMYTWFDLSLEGYNDFYFHTYLLDIYLRTPLDFQ